MPEDYATYPNIEERVIFLTPNRAERRYERHVEKVQRREIGVRKERGRAIALKQAASMSQR